MDSSAHTLRRLRQFTTAWVILCIVVAIGAAWQVAALRDATTSLDEAGRALERTGGVLGQFERIPGIRSVVGDAGDRVSSQGAETRAAAADASSDILVVAVMIGLGIALLPTIPLVFLTRALTAIAGEPRAPQ